MKRIIEVIIMAVLVNVIVYSLIRCVEAEERVRAEQEKNRIENIWRVSK